MRNKVIIILLAIINIIVTAFMIVSFTRRDELTSSAEYKKILKLEQELNLPKTSRITFDKGYTRDLKGVSRYQRSVKLFYDDDDPYDTLRQYLLANSWQEDIMYDSSDSMNVFYTRGSGEDKLCITVNKSYITDVNTLAITLEASSKEHVCKHFLENNQ